VPDVATGRRLVLHVTQIAANADPLALHWIACPLPETESNIPAIVRLRALANPAEPARVWR